MVSEIHGSLSGIDASLKRTDTSAQNTANLSTSGFKKDTVLQSEGRTGAFVVHIEKSLTPGLQLPSPDDTIVEGSNLDITEGGRDQVSAKAALDSALEAGQSLIDIIV